MNTIAHLAAIVAVGRLSIWLYDDLGEPLLGFAAIGVLLILLVWVWWAIRDDSSGRIGGSDDE